MELKINSTIPLSFEKQEEIEDSRFTKVKIWLMHTGKNLNNSIFKKEVVEDALESLSNIPIVGYITKDKNNESDFNGHEQRIVIDKDGASIEYLGRVYGIIPETNNAQFEKKTVDGVEREYLTCEGLLYNKFPEAVDIFERDGDKSQSMELEPSSIEGKFNKQGVYEFSKFRFEAACVLGDGVTPAMTGSLVEKFSSSSLNNQFQEMLTEFNKFYTTYTDTKGGEKVDKKIELLEKYSHLDEEVLNEIKDNLDSYSLEELEDKLKSYEVTETEEENQEQPEDQFEENETDVEEPEEKVETDFALTGKQLQKEIRNSLYKEKYTDSWGWESNAYWYVDHDDNRIYAEDAQAGRLVGINYSLKGDFVEIDFDSKKAVKISFVDMEEGETSEFTVTSKERNEFELNQQKELTTKEVENKFAEDRKEIESAQKELNELKDFKATKEREEKLAVIEKFTELSDDVVKPYVEGVDSYSKEDLEIRLLAEVGRKNLSFSKKDSKKKKEESTILTSTSFTEEQPTNQPAWFELVEQYKSKK